MFLHLSLSRGVSVQGCFCPGDLCPGGLCPGGLGGGSLSGGLCVGWSLSRGALSGGSLSRGSLSVRSLSGGLCPGGSLSGRSLSRGLSVRETSYTVNSGRYASYWNAFLLYKWLTDICNFCAAGHLRINTEERKNVKLYHVRSSMIHQVDIQSGIPSFGQDCLPCRLSIR